jgi:transcriptional regulator with XRE-family HTH domain
MKGKREEGDEMNSEARTFDEVLSEKLQDPEFRTEWERTALARDVANAVIKYRLERKLSQRKLAEQLGWKQPAVARLEVAENNPSFATLCDLAQKLGMELILDITPMGPHSAGSTLSRQTLRCSRAQSLPTAPASPLPPGPRPELSVQQTC